MQKVLIIGYGKMGHIHGRHLSEMGVPWEYHDPHVSGGVLLDTNGFTHAIISTPIETHYEVYRQLDSFLGSILIEKPVIVEKSQLHVLQDPRVFPGLVERYNPITKHFSLVKDDIDKIKFSRTSVDCDLKDIGIHDIDLAFVALGKNYEIIHSSYNDFCDTFSVCANFDGKNVCFQWYSSNKRIRVAIIFKGNKTDFLDFEKQEINRCSSGFTWPIEAELKAFLNNKWHDSEIGYLSHKFLIECLDLCS
jgi:hypothetical protein